MADGGSDGTAHIGRWLGPGVQLVHLNEDGLFALEKPEGILCHPNRPGIGANTLFHLPYDPQRQAYVAADGMEFYLLNRIDSATGGLVIGSLNYTTAQLVRQAFRNRAVKKTYYAYVWGRLEVGERCWRNDLAVKKIGNHLRTSSGGDRTAISRVQMEMAFRLEDIDISRLKLHPLTGRTHQLRIQCALRHVPIIGDKIYGDFALNRRLKKLIGMSGLQLRSAAIEIPYEKNGSHVIFRCESPNMADFCAIERCLSVSPQRT